MLGGHLVRHGPAVVAVACDDRGQEPQRVGVGRAARVHRLTHEAARRRDVHEHRQRRHGALDAGAQFTALGGWRALGQVLQAHAFGHHRRRDHDLIGRERRAQLVDVIGRAQRHECYRRGYLRLAVGGAGHAHDAHAVHSALGVELQPVLAAGIRQRVRQHLPFILRDGLVHRPIHMHAT